MTERPQNLAEIAQRADSLEHFGYEFADWLHTIRRTHSRKALDRSIREEPLQLSFKFRDGIVADAWLAAYAEQIARQINRTAPAWVHDPKRVSPEPWFSVDGKRSRLEALRDSPPPFKNRNLFTPRVDLPLNLRPGRPPVSAEHKRRKNAERQRRFRQRRARELDQLRAAQAATAPAAVTDG